MRITNIEDVDFTSAFGIDMASLESFSAFDHLRSSYGLIAPGGMTTPHKHDESEVFVILSGQGTFVSDGEQHHVTSGSVAIFKPFEAHILRNAGQEPLRFVAFYWRDPVSRIAATESNPVSRFADRPAFVFSTPPTPNGDLHLGHLSGPYLGADVYVRFLRAIGQEAYHLTGSDDFQSYVVGRARQEGTSPQQIADRYSKDILQTLEMMDIHLDQYTVTSRDATYQDGLRDFFSRLIAGGMKFESGLALFDGETEGYLHEVDVLGTCPTCGSPSGGNICEECGEPNTCVEFTNPHSKLSDASPQVGHIKRWMVNLSDMKDVVLRHQRRAKVSPRLEQLAEKVLSRPDFRVAISHPADWGVRPAESLEGNQVIWVWPEMAYGFLHGIASLGHRLGQDWRADQPKKEWKIVHFFGYDNSFYHTILYPALYKLAYPDWDCDIDYNENEFYLLDSLKFSTSRRHAIWGRDILTDKSVDAVRWYLGWTRGEHERTNFSLPDFHANVDRILVGQWQAWLSSLGQRVQEDFDGRAPDAGAWTPMHTGYMSSLHRRLESLCSWYGADNFSLNHVVEELNAMVKDALRLGKAATRLRGNAFLRDEYRTAIALELATANMLALTAAPLMPRFADCLAQALGLNDTQSWPKEVPFPLPGKRLELAGLTFFVRLDPGASSDDVDHVRTVNAE